MLEWIKAVGPVLISWPVVGLVALALFYRPLLDIAKQFTGPDVRKAKIGPVEIEREIVKLSEKVEEQKAEQERQKAEIESLRFLIESFVSPYELAHLQKLASGEPFPYRQSAVFEVELRRLRSLGMIENRVKGRGIRSMSEEGDLRDYFQITDKGRDYLRLRGEFE
jgi:hypothetical protein